MTLKTVNELPSPTWNHLEINGIDLVVPAVEGYEPALAEPVPVEAAYAPTAGGEAAAQAPSAGAAISAGQADAAEASAFDAPEASKTPTGPWAGLGAGEEFTVAGGCGVAAGAWLEAAAAAGESRMTVDLADYECPDEPIVIDLCEVGGVATVDVTTGRGCRATVVLVAGDSLAQVAGADAETPLPTGGWLVRVDAGQDSRIDLVSFVAPGAGVQMIDSTGVRTGDGAQVTVRQFFLGAGVLASGFAADLAGQGSALALDARYAGRGEEVLDFGYAVRNRGPRTTSDLAMHGVLTDRASKSLRTTIDLMHGAKGASGVENESVILAGDEVVNKSLPVILCDEDDVAGTHGASIGEVDPDQLAYLATRGLDGEEARALLLEATYAAALDASQGCEAAHAAVYAATVRALGAEVAAELDMAAA